MANVLLVRNGIIESNNPSNGLRRCHARSHSFRTPTKSEHVALHISLALCLRRSVGAS